MPTLSGNNPQYSISKNIRLYAGWGATASAVSRVEIENLQEIPDLSNAQGETETIEITTLKDAYHEYTDGLKNYAESSELSFKFLYSPEEYHSVYELISDDTQTGKYLFWFVVLPDGSTFTIKSKSASTVINGVGVAAAITYTLNIVPSGMIEYSFSGDNN